MLTKWRCFTRVNDELIVGEKLVSRDESLEGMSSLEREGSPKSPVGCVLRFNTFALFGVH